MEGVLDLSLTRSSDVAVVRASGHLTVPASSALVDAIAFVAADDDLVVDLAGVTSIDPAAAHDVVDALASRPDDREVVIVAGLAGVTLQLVLAGVDHLAPVVQTRADALTVIRQRVGALASVGDERG